MATKTALNKDWIETACMVRNDDETPRAARLSVGGEVLKASKPKVMKKPCIEDGDQEEDACDGATLQAAFCPWEESIDHEQPARRPCSKKPTDQVPRVVHTQRVTETEPFVNTGGSV